MPLVNPFKGLNKPESGSDIDNPFNSNAVSAVAPKEEEKPQPQQVQLDNPFIDTVSPVEDFGVRSAPTSPQVSSGETPLPSTIARPKQVATSIAPHDMDEVEERAYLPDLMDTGIEGFGLGKLIDTVAALDLPIFSVFTDKLGIDDKVVKATQGVRDGVTATYLRAAGLMSEKSADLLSSSFWGVPALDKHFDPTALITGKPLEEWAKLVMGSKKVAHAKHGLTATSERYDKELEEMLEAEGVGGLRRVSRDATRFIIPYLTFSKFAAGNATRNYVAAPLADLAAFSHTEERLSNAIEDMNVPIISSAVGKYMAADEDDSEAIGMLKQALDGILLGKITDTAMATLSGVFRGTVRTKAKVKSKTKGLDESQRGMPLSTPKGWEIEELDTVAAVKARELLSNNLEIADGEDAIEAAVKMYKRNLQDSGVWNSLDEGDQVAKLEWFAERAANTFDESGKLAAKPKPKATTKDLDRWDTMWKENNKKVEDYFTNQKKRGFKGVVEDIDKALFDRSGPLRSKLEKTPEGALAARRLALSAGATAKASREADIAIREVYKDRIPGMPVWKTMAKEKKAQLDKLIMLRRFRTIKSYNPKWSEKGNPLTAQTEEFYSTKINQMKEELGEEQFADLARRSNTFFENIIRPLDDMLESGVISKDEWTKLSRFSYSPVRWIEELDTPIAQYTGKDGRAISINKSGIEPLSSGSKKLIETDTEQFLEEVIMRTNSISSRNRANQALYGYAKASPDNEVVRLKRPKGAAKEDWVEIKVMEAGDAKHMYMAKEYTDQWSVNSSFLGENAKKFIQYSSGAPVTRYFATGPANPEFALTNFPRDVMYNMLVSDQYSAFMPFAAKQYTEDLVEVMGDAVFRKGQYENYIKEGGGMEFLSQQGIPGSTGGSKMGRSSTGDLENIMAYFNTTSEIINRLAVRNRAIKNIKKATAKSQGIRVEDVVLTKDQMEQATFEARTTIDFDQGGMLAKATNEGIPYFNAAQQGLRGYARSWKKNPTKAAAYAAQLMGLYGSIHYINRSMNPEGTADTPEYIRDNYLNVTTPLSFIDEEGDRRYLGLRFPVDHSSVGLKIAAEALVDKSMNNRTPSDVEISAIDQAGRMLESQFGIVPGVTMPPLISALIAYKGNYDWWRDSPVWTGEQGIPAEMEFEAGETSEAARDIGQVTGMSPARLEGAMRQVFPSNIFTLGMGQGYRMMTQDVERDQLDPIEKSMVEQIQAMPFARRFTFLTSPHAREADAINESMEEAKAPQVQINRNIDNLSQRVGQGDLEVADALEWVRQEVPTEVQSKAASRLIDQIKIQEVQKSLGYTGGRHLPSNRWWSRLSAAPAAAKAKELTSHMGAINNLENEKEKKEAKRMMQAMMSQVPGFSPEKNKEFAFYLHREMERQGLDSSSAFN